MQDEFDAIVRRRQPVARPQDEDEFGAIVNRRRQPVAAEVRPPLWERIKATGRAIADDPLEATKSIGKGLAQNVGDLGVMASGDPVRVAQEVASEFAKGPGAEKRLLSRAVGAGSLLVPALRVGGVATSVLANTAANAGLGAAQTPDDPMLGAVLGGAIPLAGKAVGKVTGATARAARSRLTPNMNLDGVTDDLGRGLDDAQRNTIPKRRTARTLKETVAIDDIGGVESVNRILSERTPRQLAGLDASVVQPRPNPLAPAADAPIPETFLAEFDGPRREVVAVPGAKKALVDPEVRADRVAGERLDVAEQRAAEKQMVLEAKEIDRAAQEAETASGMLGRANKGFVKSERAKNAARSALARRRGVPLGDTPVSEALGGDISPSNPPAIPEVPPAPVVASQGILEPPAGMVGVGIEPPTTAAPTPSGLPPAETPFLNWRTLGVDPAKPDALNMSASARIQAAASRPDMAERLAQERGKTTFAAMNAEAQKSWAIQQLGIDPLAVDSKKLVGLSGAQIHALKAPLLENAGLMESIAREMVDLEGDDLVKATQTFERLEKSNDELLATIQREGSARGRDLGALRQMANMTTDPAVWLVKAKKALGDTPMTASVHARIMKLAKEAAEACGGA